MSLWPPISYFRLTIYARLKGILRRMREKPVAISVGLEFYEGPLQREEASSSKLYLVPTTHGEHFDPDFSPVPTNIAQLPNGDRWTQAYIISAIEILAGHRPVVQISRSTHRFTYNNLLKSAGSLSELPKIRRIHRNQPIEGVIELTTTLAFKARVRALVARFEGVDGRWLCTELELL